MMELILQNKEGNSLIIEFVVVLATVSIFSMALTGFTIKKILQLMLK